jgi:hypothetical protein
MILDKTLLNQIQNGKEKTVRLGDLNSNLALTNDESVFCIYEENSQQNLEKFDRKIKSFF